MNQETNMVDEYDNQQETSNLNVGNPNAYQEEDGEPLILSIDDAIGKISCKIYCMYAPMWHLPCFFFHLFRRFGMRVILTEQV